MKALARAWEILTWRHWAWVVGLAIAWPTLRRIGMFGNNIESMTLVLWSYDVVMNVIAAHVFLAAIVLAEGSTDDPKGPSGLRYATAILAAVVVTIAVAVAAPSAGIGEPTNRNGRAYLKSLAKYPKHLDSWPHKLNYNSAMILASAFVACVYVGLRRARREERALREAQLTREDAERRLATADLAAIEEKVEPDEVLRRLAEIEEQYVTDRARADAMLDELIAFLRAAIPKLRNEDLDHEPVPAHGSPG